MSIATLNVIVCFICYFRVLTRGKKEERRAMLKLTRGKKEERRAMLKILESLKTPTIGLRVVNTNQLQRTLFA